ncbi:hypothetical protein FQZ97_1011080 [compost metagenome]
MVLLVELGDGLRRLLGELDEFLDGIGNSGTDRVLHGHGRRTDQLDLAGREPPGAGHLGQCLGGLALSATHLIHAPGHLGQLIRGSARRIASEDQRFAVGNGLIAALLVGQHQAAGDSSCSGDRNRQRVDRG